VAATSLPATSSSFSRSYHTSALTLAALHFPTHWGRRALYTHSLYQHTLIEEYIDCLYVDAVLSFLEIEILPVSHTLFITKIAERQTDTTVTTITLYYTTLYTFLRQRKLQAKNAVESSYINVLLHRRITSNHFRHITSARIKTNSAWIKQTWKKKHFLPHLERSTNDSTTNVLLGLSGTVVL
jgi:hypothetical protein